MYKEIAKIAVATVATRAVIDITSVTYEKVKNLVMPSTPDVKNANKAIEAGMRYTGSLFGKIDFNSMSEAALLEDIKKEDTEKKVKEVA